MKSKPIDSDSIRTMFIDFFKEKGHEYCHSSSVVLPDDPTLLFVNAGMNQFKAIFTEQIDPTSKFAHIKRAVNSQKCIRAGGKHNDLDDVGKDVYHHTFFEMLGNWSFGDYFKREAIYFAWTFLTEKVGLDKTRLYATYFEGDKTCCLPVDDETKDIWLEYLPANRILTGSFKDNFWEMGDVGPCGPCTELHYDRVGNRDASHLINKDDPNVLEIWNIVFIQFNRESSGKLSSLPRKHVDTGMGLERLASIVQNKLSNYDTDIFTPIFNEIYRLTEFKQPYKGMVGSQDSNQIDQAYRVVADHCRTLVIAISDGVYPKNTGRGYVVRRILRRAIRFAFEKLGATSGFMGNLIVPVAEMLSKTFPEIKNHITSVVDVVNEEETQFLKTMSRGRRYFEKATEGLSPNSVLSGEFVWKLYDTYGFPVDLTEIMCQEKQMHIDAKGFEAAKSFAHKQSKQNNPFSAAGDDNYFKKVRLDMFQYCVDFFKANSIPPTDDKFKYTCYMYEPVAQMYVFTPLDCKILAIIVDGKFVKKVSTECCVLILDRTCFYAESGGQIGDRGILSSGFCNCVISDTKAFGGYIFHFGSITRGILSLGETLSGQVTGQSRSEIMKNHTATHILNLALRERMGKFAEQKGSLVTNDRLRFDVSYQKHISLDDMNVIEDICRQYINDDHIVSTKVMKIADALRVPDVRTLADEKYPDYVRVVHLGSSHSQKINSNRLYQHYSVELCGGTHLERTSHCGQMCIISSEPIAKGVRRLTAITSDAAKKAFALSKDLKVHVDEIQERVKKSNDDTELCSMEKDIIDIQAKVSESILPYTHKEAYRKQLNEAKFTVNNAVKKMSADTIKKIANSVRDELNACHRYGDDTTRTVKACVGLVDLSDDRKSLNNVMSMLKSDCLKVPLLMFSVAPDSDKSKTICQAHVPKDTSRNLSADDWVSEVATIMQAKSGGSPTSAQLSSNVNTSIDDIINIAQSFAALKLSCPKDSILVFKK